MKAVIQRCCSARVDVEGKTVGSIDRGLVVFLGVVTGDGEHQANKLASKIAALRIFSDEQGRFNFSITDIEGAVLLIPNFTVCGDTRKGNRPSFSSAAAPEVAEGLYRRFAKLLEDTGVSVDTGIFGADMRVFVENDGPVSIILEV